MKECFNVRIIERERERERKSRETFGRGGGKIWYREMVVLGIFRSSLHTMIALLLLTSYFGTSTAVTSIALKWFTSERSVVSTRPSQTSADFPISGNTIGHDSMLAGLRAACITSVVIFGEEVPTYTIEYWLRFLCVTLSWRLRSRQSQEDRAVRERSDGQGLHDEWRLEDRGSERM